MSLNIKNERVHALAKELAALKGTSMTSAILQALEKEKADMLSAKAHRDAERERAHEEFVAFLATTPTTPEGALSDHDDLYDEDGLPA